MFKASAVAYMTLVNDIPNGGSVPHPCVKATWLGVGHESQYGTGARNLFGADVDPLVRSKCRKSRTVGASMRQWFSINMP